MALAADTPIPGIGQEGGRVQFTSGGLEYAVERKGGKVFHSESLRDSEGRVLTNFEAEVAYAIGSGRRGRSYLVERDGFLVQSPISWYSQENRWDLSPHSLARNDHFERLIDPSCLFCHSNQFEPREGTINGYRPPTFRGLAIGCERCHGPGERHVEAPGLGVDGIDLTIVNPAKLEPALREDVCAQCHLGGRTRIERSGRTARDYRPGLPLREFLAVFVERATDMMKKRSIGHVEQMHASRCFQASEGRLGCTSCHDPHRLPTAEERTSYYRQRCLECHAAGRGCSLPEPDRNRGGIDDNCVQCHMPRSRLTNIAHTAETNHGIPRRFEEAMSQPDSRFADRSNPSPLIASDAAFGGQSQAINLDRELGIALAGAASDSGSDRIRLARMALGLLDAHLKVSPDDLAAWQARIVALTARGQPKAALADAGAALKIAPDDERTLALAFPFFAGEGDVNEAIRIGRELVAVNPHVARYYGLLAQLLARQGRWREGAEACRAAIRLAPLGLSVRHVLIKCLLELGEHTQARAEAGIYLRFNLEVGERKLIESWLRQAR